MNPFAFDIESIPNQEMIPALPDPDVKYGNTKDPDKRAEMDREAKQKQIDNMALNPFYGRVCGFALWGNNRKEWNVIDEISDACEIELIEKVLSALSFTTTTAPSVITWNGYNFDFRFVFMRAMLLRVSMPSGCPGLSWFLKKYSRIPHCDMMQEMVGWASGKFISLDEAACVLLGEKKIDHDFKQFPELIKTGRGHEIGIYNLKDAELTYRIYERSSYYLFGERNLENGVIID